MRWRSLKSPALARSGLEVCRRLSRTSDAPESPTGLSLPYAARVLRQWAIRGANQLSARPLEQQRQLLLIKLHARAVHSHRSRHGANCSGVCPCIGWSRQGDRFHCSPVGKSTSVCSFLPRAKKSFPSPLFPDNVRNGPLNLVSSAKFGRATSAMGRFTGRASIDTEPPAPRTAAVSNLAHGTSR
jgi:hypothetical protein